MGKIFLITAPSGAGKTTLAQALQRQGYWNECVSTTTRPMREGEAEGETYYFKNKDEFISMQANGEFAERVEYDKNLYGITNAEIQRVMNKGRHVFIIVEFNGYEQVKALYPEAVGIFLHMSKEDCLANMLLRGDSIEKSLSRIGRYEDEMKNRGEFDYVLKNVRNKQQELETMLRYIIRQYI